VYHSKYNPIERVWGILEQHLVISKVHGYTRQHKTRRTLETYDRIIRSLYLLNYLDSLSLRHHVQRALNRGESYHQLRRAVAYANSGEYAKTSNLSKLCEKSLTEHENLCKFNVYGIVPRNK